MTKKSEWQSLKERQEYCDQTTCVCAFACGYSIPVRFVFNYSDTNLIPERNKWFWICARKPRPVLNIWSI